jgi:hypothetical protein
MPDPNLPLLEDAVRKLTPFLDEIVFVGGITLGLLITDKAAAPIRGTNDVDVIAEIVTYADYIAFSERLREARFTEDAGEKPLTCRWHNGALTLDVLALNEEVLGFTNIWYLRPMDSPSRFYESCTEQSSALTTKGVSNGPQTCTKRDRARGRACRTETARCKRFYRARKGYGR